MILVAVITATVGLCLVATRDDGATSPEAALHELIDAVEHRDLAGVLVALPPAERLAVTDRLPTLAAQLRTLGLLAGGDDTASAFPVVTVDDLRVTTTPYDTDVAAVDLIGGTLTTSFGTDAGGPVTPEGSQLLVGRGDTAAPASSTTVRDLAVEPVRLIAVREGGGWHISPTYSVVDAMAADGLVPEGGIAVPDVGSGPYAYGAETSEGAVVDLFRAYADSDLDRLVALLAVDEARGLYDYASLILPGTTQLLEDLRVGGQYDVVLNSISTSVEGSGDSRRVRVTGLDLDVRDQIHKQHVVLHDGCLHVDARIEDDDEPYQRHDVCAGEWDDPDAEVRPLDNVVANAAVFGGGAELPTFTVIERNGRWFISPIRSILDATIDTLDQLDASDQRSFLDRLSRSAHAGVGDGLTGSPLPADLTPEERAATLVGRCDALVVDGPDGGAVRDRCVDRLVRTGSIAWDAIAQDRRAGLAPPPEPPLEPPAEPPS